MVPMMEITSRTPVSAVASSTSPYSLATMPRSRERSHRRRTHTSHPSTGRGAFRSNPGWLRVHRARPLSFDFWCVRTSRNELRQTHSRASYSDETTTPCSKRAWSKSQRSEVSERTSRGRQVPPHPPLRSNWTNSSTEFGAHGVTDD